MTTSLESILHEALCFEAGAFDDDQAIPSAELVEGLPSGVGEHKQLSTPTVRRRQPRSTVNYSAASCSAPCARCSSSRSGPRSKVRV
jgi:hypothetical protein